MEELLLYFFIYSEFGYGIGHIVLSIKAYLLSHPLKISIETFNAVGLNIDKLEQGLLNNTLTLDQINVLYSQIIPVLTEIHDVLVQLSLVIC